MALETAFYIADLNTANPLSTDTVSQADDHLRLIKSVLKATFPNLNAPVTATPFQLNNAIPVGVITMWSGSIATIPTGWAICNGTNGTPNLINRFVVAAGGTYAPGATGGSLVSGAGGGHFHTELSAGSHSHSGNTGSTVLTIDQIPAHTHSYSLADGEAEELGTGTPTTSGFDSLTTTTTGSTGGGLGHEHTIDTDGVHTHSINAVGDHTHAVAPPYYALAYIMKV
jgi:hypothetical protein